MKHIEIREIGYIALIDTLGVVGTLQFLQQLDIGTGEYTKERQKADEPTLEDFRQFVESRKST